MMEGEEEEEEERLSRLSAEATAVGVTSLGRTRLLQQSHD